MIVRHIKNHLLLVIIALSVFMRYIYLDRFPTGITNDELHFVLNAKAVFYRFSDMSSRWFPLSFSTIPNESSSELTYILLSPFIGPLQTNLFTARFPFALAGTISVLVIYLLVLQITKSKTMSIASSFVAAINPWFIYVNRTSFDAPVSLLFFLISILLILQKRAVYTYVSIISLTLAFYTYIGSKVIFIPFVLITIYFSHRFQPTKSKASSIIVILFSFFLFFNFVIKTLPSASRTSELWFPGSQEISSQVKIEKNQSLQNPLKPILTNNYTIYFRNFITKYLNSFSSDVLFTTGDHTFMVSLWKHGYFYIFEAPLLIFGLLYVYNYYRRLFWYLISILLISPLPEAFRKDVIPAYAFHSFLQYPFLVIIIASGILFTLKTLKNTTFSRAFIISLYIFGVINFADTYFFKYPVYQPEGFGFSRRLLSRFLYFESFSQKPIVVFTKEPDTLFRSYLFYNNLYLNSTFDRVKSVYSQNRDLIKFNNLTFTSQDRQLEPTTQSVVVVDRQVTNRQYSALKLSINHLGDNHELYSFFNAATCSDVVLEPFSHNLNLFDLSIESLSKKDFCRLYITKTF